MFNLNNKKGFTLIELVVVLIIIGILVLLAVSKFTSYADKAKYTNIINDIRVVEDVSLVDVVETNSNFPTGTSQDEKPLNVIASTEKIFAKNGVIIKQAPNEEDRLPDVGEVSDILVSDLKNGFYKLDKENFVLPNTRTRLKGDFYIDKDLSVVYRSSIKHSEGEFIVIDDTGLFGYDEEEAGVIAGYNKNHQYFKDKSNQKFIDGNKYYILPPIPDYRILNGKKIPITEIDVNAFYNKNFTGNFVAGNNLKTIGNYAFYKNKLTGNFYYKNIKTIKSNAFYENDFTGDFVSGDNLETIAHSAFYNNNFTGDFVARDNLKTIGDMAFYNNNFTGDFIPPERYKEFQNRFNNTSFSNVP